MLAEISVYGSGMAPVSPLNQEFPALEELILSEANISFQLFVGAMSPPSTGRNNICGRFTRHLNVICIDTFDDTTLEKIFGSIMTWHFSSQEDAVIQTLSKVSSDFAEVTSSIFNLKEFIEKKIFFIKDGFIELTVNCLTVVPQKHH